MVLWPFRLIADKLVKMIGGRAARHNAGGDEEEVEANEGRLFSFRFDRPVSCRSRFVDVPHVRQRFDWDCGLACVLMVLRTIGLEQFDIHDLEKLCRTTSIWTVDLAYLLHKFSVDFSFLTVTLGANPDYSAESYYREQLQDDIGRVDGLFEKALEAGISIQCRSISAKDISWLILSGQCVAVALVNKIKLSQSWTKDAHVAECYMSNTDYMAGHYVVICGYDGDNGEFEIRDPASSRKYEKVSMKCLDEARKSYGTDEDILLVKYSFYGYHMRINFACTMLSLRCLFFKAMARSPQSTLCAWSAASNKGSSNGPSLVSSPPSTSPMKKQNKDPADLLYEAAGQVIRMRSNDLGRRESLYDRGILGAPIKPTLAASVASENASFGYHATGAVTPVLTHQQLQATQVSLDRFFHHPRQQQTMKQPLSVAWGTHSKARGGGRPLDLSPSAWPPLRKPPPQQHQPPLPGSGMRAVFLHNAGSRKESAGTGVFLPRTVGKKLEPRKKTGCSTVLVPDRVVQALNLNLKEFAAQPRFPGGFVLTHDALVGRSSAGLSHQRRKHNLTASPTPDAAVATAATHDIGLPQEWTY
ncbi:unnamed protein product [Musa hybrid cultivar]